MSAQDSSKSLEYLKDGPGETTAIVLLAQCSITELALLAITQSNDMVEQGGTIAGSGTENDSDPEDGPGTENDPGPEDGPGTENDPDPEDGPGTENDPDPEDGPGTENDPDPEDGPGSDSG